MLCKMWGNKLCHCPLQLSILTFNFMIIILELQRQVLGQDKAALLPRYNTTGYDVMARLIYWTGYSPSSTPLPDSCSQPGAPNASPRFSATFTGCGSWNGLNSISAFWHSDVSLDLHRHISLREFVGQPMWKVVATSTHLPL